MSKKQEKRKPVAEFYCSSFINGVRYAVNWGLDFDFRVIKSVKSELLQTDIITTVSNSRKVNKTYFFRFYKKSKSHINIFELLARLKL